MAISTHPAIAAGDKTAKIHLACQTNKNKMAKLGAWLEHDPLAQLCLAIQPKVGKRSGESWGAAAVQINGDRKRIVGLGRTQRGQDAFLMSVGTMNHAEITAAWDAVTFGYDPRKIIIHVAGGNVATNRHFFNPAETPFTCTICANYCTDFRIPAFGVPSPYGWKITRMPEALESAEKFKQKKSLQGQSSEQLRDDISAGSISLKIPSIAEISPQKMRLIIKNLRASGYEIAPHVERFLRLFPDLVSLPADIVRLAREGQPDPKLGLLKIQRPGGRSDQFLYSALAGERSHQSIAESGNVVTPRLPRMKLIDYLVRSGNSKLASKINKQLGWSP